MNESNKLPPERVAALAERLQGELKRRRPRTWLIVVAALLLASAGLGLLAWWLRERPAPPRLDVIAFDVLAAPGATPELMAQLVCPDPTFDASALLARREILFFPALTLFKPAKDEPQARATTDAHGRAVVTWTSVPADKPQTVVARYVNVANKQGSNDQATLLAWPAGSKILLVDIDETLVQVEPTSWLAVPPAAILPRPDAMAALRDAEKKQYHIAYLAVRPSQAAAYPRVRAWVHSVHADKQSFPPGPVLGRHDYASSADPIEARRDRVNELKARLGEQLTLVTGSTVVPGVRTLILDGKGGPPGTNRAANWAGVLALLDAPPP